MFRSFTRLVLKMWPVFSVRSVMYTSITGMTEPENTSQMSEVREMYTQQKPFASMLLIVMAMALCSVTATASVVPIGPGAFPAGSTLISFDGLLDGTEVNGLSTDGVVFTYSLGDGQVIIDGGPGTTNNVAPPNVVSLGDPSGVLTLILPKFVDSFGFGYAMLNVVPILNATTITVFDGATNLGSISYDGFPDPAFTGGFAGILSTTPFNRVELTFNSAEASAFAIDNVRFAATIPEPSTVLLVLGGGLGLLWRTRRRSVSQR